MRIGEVQELLVARDTPQGFYLTDGTDEVLLPNNLIPRRVKIGDRLKVFVHKDSEDRPLATTQKPRALPGEFAVLRVVSVTEFGAFLDWNLDKDLFCPLAEQVRKMSEGESHFVRLYVDDVSDRIVCSARWRRFVTAEGPNFVPGQEVDLLVAGKKPDALDVVINQTFRGSLFRDEWHERLDIGDSRKGFIKSTQPGTNRIAVSLRPQGYRAVLGARERVLEALVKNGGTINMSDRSSPEEIQRRFGLSKGSFKKLIGTMFREGQIDILDSSIRLRK